MNLISTATVFLQKPYSTASISLKSTTTSYFHTFRWYCSINGSHYLNTVDRTCYASCPVGTQLSVTIGKCFPCGYTCATCVLFSWDPLYGSNSTCVSCNASRFRTLINSSCMCNNGYFDDGYSSTCRQCSSVNNLTSTCTFTLDSTKPTVYYQQIFAQSNWTIAVLPLYKSLTCLSGYIVFNNLCTSCSQAIPYCISCTNPTACTTCNTSTTKYTDQKCYLCNLTNCVLCKQDNICDQCTAGYILFNSLCVICSQAIPYCDSCANATVCITCNASATKYTDQKCYLCN
jgi:proprotein convertase subtilisin/kexin type 5